MDTYHEFTNHQYGVGHGYLKGDGKEDLEIRFGSPDSAVCLRNMLARLFLAGMSPDLDAEELMRLGVNLGIAVMIVVVVLYFVYWFFNLTRRRSEIWKRLQREQ